MALPAQIFFAVSRQVDLWRSDDLRILAMALSAKFAVGRFHGGHAPRTNLVLVRSRVTGGTFQQGVRRHGLPALDASVARRASLRRLRRLRIVRVMASYAGLHRIVNHGIDLREAQRSGRIVGVTERAEFPALRHLRLHRDGVLRMLFGGTMAGFARQASMIAGLFRRVLRSMAGGTYRRSGVLNLSCSFPFDCLCPLQLPVGEVRRQNCQGCHDASDQHQEDNRQPYDLVRNLWQQGFHWRPFSYTPGPSAEDLQEPQTLTIHSAQPKLLRFPRARPTPQFTRAPATIKFRRERLTRRRLRVSAQVASHQGKTVPYLPAICFM